MSFNSYEFLLLFLPLALLCYFGANRLKVGLGRAVLLIASFVFYAYFDLFCLALLGGSILLNYALGRSLQARHSKAILICGIVLNVAFLSFFKYSELLNEILQGGLHLELLFPLGISFLTFQNIAYLVDSYRGEAKSYSLMDFALFSAFFPKVAQGPICYHHELIPQFQNAEPHLNFDNISKGLYSFAIGLSKKVILAETLGKLVDFNHANPASLNSLEALLTILAYAFQLYFDFSGYCDMAVGVAKMFNLDLPQNFNSPYKARSIDDFWKRWHITLTRFLTKYIYIPFGGNRKGKLRTYLNILLVFLVSGIWHGVGLPFLLWGALHGFAQCLSRLFKKPYAKIPAVLQWLCTFVFVNIAWVYFRADSIESAHVLFSRVFSGGFSINAELAESLLQATIISIPSQFVPISYVLIALTGLCLCLTLIPKNTHELTAQFRPGVASLLFSLVLLLWSLLSLSGVSGFLYTNF